VYVVVSALVPSITVEPGTKFVPVIVIVVSVLPLLIAFGAMELKVGDRL
jgi:hypothetical protein